MKCCNFSQDFRKYIITGIELREESVDKEQTRAYIVQTAPPSHHHTMVHHVWPEQCEQPEHSQNMTQCGQDDYDTRQHKQEHQDAMGNR